MRTWTPAARLAPCTAMSTASAQRLKRTRVPEQMALDLGIPAALDLSDPAASDLEQDQFAQLAKDVAAAQPRATDPWEHSPYRWFKQLPSARRGSIGQVLLARWLTHCGVPHAPRHGDGDHDLVIGAGPDPIRAQVRVSTLWSGGEFIFQGIKAGQYDQVLLLAVGPHQVQLWAVPQGQALANLNAAGWITVTAGRAPAWMAPYGGTLTSATRLLAR